MVARHRKVAVLVVHRSVRWMTVGLAATASVQAMTLHTAVMPQVGTPCQRHSCSLASMGPQWPVWARSWMAVPPMSDPGSVGVNYLLSVSAFFGSPFSMANGRPGSNGWQYHLARGLSGIRAAAALGPLGWLGSPHGCPGFVPNASTG